MRQEQSHLSYHDTVNYGSYYTPKHIIDSAYSMLRKNIPAMENCTIADTSCGYGSFLRLRNSIGADCDEAALLQARRNGVDNRLFHHNSLHNVRRSQYNLNNDDKLIIIGNPPYNDRTSIIRNGIKQETCQIDADLRHRDLGISFLLSYDKLRADYICVLHPLSYLIKKANFNSLGSFKKHYVLADNLIISSGEFAAASKVTQFPIIIALYKRDSQGMDYETICRFPFRTKEGKIFSINNFDKLSNYVTKYPNHKYVGLDKTVAFFWTMRDINALKRTRSFIQNEVYNSIRVPADKLPLYCYADIFKDYIPHIPYYFGNSDVMIDYPAFERLKHVFIQKSLKKYPFLKGIAPHKEIPQADLLLNEYFCNLLGEHYANP